MRMPMDMPMEHPGGHPPLHEDHGTCPYGSSPALAALPVLPILPGVVEQPAAASIPSPQIAYFEISARAQSPRGPPARLSAHRAA
jgi:hypothetical protein